MMALVAYDNSDGSDYENDDDETTVVLPATTLNNALQGLPPKESNIIEQKEADDQNLFNLLPKPVNQKTLVKEEDDEFLHKKESISDVKPKSRITVPSLEDFKDVKDTVPSVRPKVSNGKKSGLLSLLPQPKNGANITTKMLIPHSVTNKPHTATVKKKNPLPSPMKKTIVEAKSTLIADYSDDSDDDIQNDFFSIHKQVELPPADAPLDIGVKNDIQSTSKKEPRSLESYFKKDVHVELEPDYLEPEDDVANHSDVSQNEVEETKNNDIVLDEEAILKLCGSRGKRKREEIQIVDVNQQEVLKDAREMLLRGLMDDTTKRQSHSKKRGNEPTSQQKRKHQITYLAHQAKANEAELQNQWANNRMTKRQTQSKYGF